MRKFTQSYNPFDESSERWLIKLDELLQSDIFLSGLGETPPPIPKSLGYPTVSDIDKADDLWVSQEMWVMPRPWPFQYFCQELENAEGMQAKSYSEAGGDIAKIRKETHFKTPGKWRIGGGMFGQNTLDRLEQIKVGQQGITENHDKLFITDMVENCFLLLLKSCYMGGIDQSEFFYRMYEGFMAGGVPCGWLGDVALADGGKAQDCLVMLHFGEIEKECISRGQSHQQKGVRT